MENLTLTDIEKPEIITLNGKDYSFDITLPTLAGVFFSANYQNFALLMPGNIGSISLEETEKTLTALQQLINLVNKKKYPELTVEFLNEHCNMIDYQSFIAIYYRAWFKIMNPKISTELIPPKDSGGK